MFRHIVLFRVRDAARDERVAAALGELWSLAVLPGLAPWQGAPANSGPRCSR